LYFLIPEYLYSIGFPLRFHGVEYLKVGKQSSPTSTLTVPLEKSFLIKKCNRGKERC